MVGGLFRERALSVVNSRDPDHITDDAALLLFFNLLSVKVVMEEGYSCAEAFENLLD